MAGSHALARDGPGSAPARDGQLGALLGHVARGDQVAFEAVHDRTAGQVPRVIQGVAHYRSVRGGHGEVLVDAWRSASRYDQARGSATTRRLTLAHRHAVDRVRSPQISRTGDVRCIAADPRNHVTKRPRPGWIAIKCADACAGRAFGAGGLPARHGPVISAHPARPAGAGHE